MRLPAELHVERVLDADLRDVHRFLPDERRSLVTLCGQDVGQLRHVESRQRRVDRLHEIMAKIGDNAAQCVGDAGAGGHKNLGDAKLAGQRRGMKRAGPAKGEKREITRVLTKRDRHHAGRAGHAGGGDTKYRLGGALGIDSQPVAKLGLEDLTDARQIDIARNRFQLVDIKPAKQHVGIGNGRLCPAAAITDRARVRAGALRPDLQKAGLVDPCDRSATGADGADIDHRHMDRHRIFKLDLVRDRRLASPDQRDIGRGAAHVIGDQVGPSGAAAGIGGGDHAGRRARHHRLRGLADDAACRNRAAIAVHHQQLATIAAFTKLVHQPPDIAFQKRLHRGVDGGGDAALELAAFRKQRMAGRDVVIRPEGGEDFGCPCLVLRIGIGVKEMHHHRFNTGGKQLLTRKTHRILIKRRYHTAGIIKPFRHLEAQVSRNDRREIALHAIGLWPGTAAKLQHVAETCGGDQPGAAELAFEHGVGRRRGAVDYKGDITKYRVGLLQRCHHPEGLVVDRAGHL